MNLVDAMNDACRQVGIYPPKSLKEGRWVRTNTYQKNGKNDASVLLFDDGQGGIAKNWQTQHEQIFSIRGAGVSVPPPVRQRDPERERRNAEDARQVREICLSIVRGCVADPHPYLERKGFTLERGLVLHEPGTVLPDTHIGRMVRKSMPETDGPLLIVPGRIGKILTTVQFITADGEKKNIPLGKMGGSCHRVAVGRETWVCEGIATALSVKAALGLLGRPATVLSAFSASNAAKVASLIEGAVIAADHDKPVEVFGGLGTGEYWSRKSGRRWIMPPEKGDFNDMHQQEGIRAVALRLREVV